MTHVPPTPDDLKTRFPKFAGVTSSVIQGALDEAARVVDDTWQEDDFRLGRMLYAAHVMTTDGHGEGTEAQLNAEGVGNFQSIKLGSLSLSQFDRDTASRTGNAFLDQFERTTFGQRFLALAARYGGGPIIVNGGEACVTHPAARDVRLPGFLRRHQGNG